MKPARVTLRALWCDQGMAHMLQLYDTVTATVPSSLILIDFGAETMFKSKVLKLNVAAPAVGTVVETLLLQQEAKLTPKLDYVLISHQDTDHWSLLNYLMDAVDELKVPMKVGKVIYGGSDWGKAASDTVYRLRTFGVDGLAPFRALDNNLSDYRDANGTLESILSIDELVLRILIANAPISSKSASMRKNGTSAVVVIDYASERMILPGDATWQTLGACNKLLKAWTKSPVQPVKVRSAPHHGSLETMTSSNKGESSDLKQLIAFTDLVKPEAAIASAGFSNSFKHPYLIILNTLGKYAVPSDTNRGLGPHDFIAYRPTIDDWELYSDKTENIYTTVLGLSSPVVVADFLFSNNDGVFLTEKFEFYGPCKAMVSVPYTSEQVLSKKRKRDESEDDSDDDGLTGISDESGRSAPIARPGLRSIFAPPPQRWVPPPRRVSPALSSAAVL